MTIRKNTLWNLFGSVSPLIVGLITIPYLLQKIGVERLGVLTIVWALIGYFSIFDFGLGRALTHQVSNLRAKRSDSEISATLKTGMLLMLIFGLLGAALVAGVIYFLGLDWLNVSRSLYGETYNATLIAVLAIPATTLTSGFKGILEGFEEFKAVNILRSILGISNFILPALSVYFLGPSLIGIVFSLLIARLVVFLAHIHFASKIINVFNLKPISAHGKESSSKLITFGAWMTVSNIISPLMVVADRFVVSHSLGAAMVVFYTLPVDFLFRLLILPAALSTTLFPRIAFCFGAKDRIEAERLFNQGLKIIAMVMLPICLGICFLSYMGLSIWLGEDFAKQAYSIASIIAVGIAFTSMAQAPHVLIQASGDVKTTSIIHLTEFLIYIPVLLISVDNFGLNGAAFSWTMRAIIDFMFLYYFARKRLNQELRGF